MKYSPDSFERKYRLERDPWNARDPANAHYHEALRRFCLAHATKKNNLKVLDLGCGEGGFSNALASAGADVCGVDVSPTAIARAREEFPQHRFFCGDIRELSSLADLDAAFDLILCGQVLYYFDLNGIENVLKGIDDRLALDGTVILASNCKGGKWFEKDYFLGLCKRSFDHLDHQAHAHHLFFAGKKTKTAVVITVDYETVEHGQKLSLDDALWERTIFAPCADLLRVVAGHGAKLTVMVEMGELLFLEKYAPAIATTMQQQLQSMVAEGHDVQLHLHPRWLPLNGATVGPDGVVALAMNKIRLHDMTADDIDVMFSAARQKLESMLQPVCPAYRTLCFRAGKYQIQPHAAIFNAMARNGYICDSSVWHGGFLMSYDNAPGYDFRPLWHPWRPYWPDRIDLCVPTNHEPGLSGILELPILSRDRERWSFDGADSTALIGAFEEHRHFGGPRIMIGHTKLVTEKSLTQLSQALAYLRDKSAVEFRTLRDVAVENAGRYRDADITGSFVADMAGQVCSPQSLYEFSPAYQKRKVALIGHTILDSAAGGEKVRVLDVGCGTGELLTLPLKHWLDSSHAQNVYIQGIDIDARSIHRANRTVAENRLTGISFTEQQPVGLADDYDVVICSEVLEHLADPAALAAELCRLVAHDGTLVVTVPNGYGYLETERRLTRNSFDVISSLPGPIKRTLMRVYRTLRRHALKNANRPSNGRTHGLMGTMNYENDVHVQFFSAAAIKKLFQTQNFDIVDSYNIQLFGGLLGSVLDKALYRESVLSRMPLWLTSGWLFALRRK